MQHLTKYKNFNKLTYFHKSLPRRRILKFKRPKWKKLQFKVTKFTKRKKLFNVQIVKAAFKRWEKKKNYFREGLKLKRDTFLFYNKRFSLKYYKKKFVSLRNDTFSPIKLFISPFYRIDILLWKLGFFQSSLEVNQAINQRNIIINFKKIKTNVFLKQGDIIIFKTKGKLNYNKLTKEVYFLHSFLEIDLYTNTIVVLKNVLDLTQTELSLLLKESIPLRYLIHYLKIK